MPSPSLSLPPLTDVDLRRLRVFDAVVRAKSFAAAQEVLNIGQATISIHIGQLEQRLGMRLCERGRGGFRLTEDGALVHEAIQDLFRSMENFRGLVASARGSLKGEVRFGAVDAMATNTQAPLDRALGRFGREAPEIVLQIDLASPQNLHQGLIDGRYHVVLSVLSPAQRFSDSLHVAPAFRERQSLYCGRGHPLYRLHPKQVTPGTLTGAAFAARSYMQDWRPPLDIEYGVHAITSHMESIAILILSGRYLGYLPAHYAQRWVEAGDMRTLIDDKASYFDQFFLVRRKNERNRAIMLLFERLLESFAGTKR